ncbi:IclR family transcriptional regulator [Halorhabdus amylolytica]|uniref:IclR family transcriptional regulator n=1 Tax=Halorhabdus amylolytica TaxID=2559573 RepID=UPI0010A9EBF0|nr:IclR family transcriptional regulator [Halorhabdus amylolytica]
MGNRSGAGPPIQSVDITCDIIDVIAEEGPIGVSRLAETLGRSKSTIHDHVTTLGENELIVERNGGYCLSLRLAGLSRQAKKQHSDFSIVREAVDELSSRVGEPAHFGSEDFGNLVYLYRTDNDADVSQPYRPDVEEPLHCTALGKAILAFMSDERVGEIIDTHGLERRTPNTIADRAELLEELERIRAQKFATDDEELANGMRSVAAPIMDDDDLIGAIGIFGPVSRFDDERIDNELSDQVKRAANLIEINSMFSE